MFNFFKKKIYNLHTFESLNEDMKRKENFYYDVENECVRIKGTDIFEELNELTFNRLRCFMWLHKTNVKTKRKLSNFEIWEYFDKKDPKQLKR